MMAAISRADAVWKGDLMSGSGRVKIASGAFDEFPVSWASRAERQKGKTSPEELIAAAHAACYSMAFSNGLAKAGITVDRKVLSDLAIHEPAAFQAIVEKAKAALAA